MPHNNNVSGTKFSHKILTTSNILTILRIMLTPVVAICINLGMWHRAFCIFFIAALTDLFDGYLARQFGEHTEFGAWLDPLADKCLIFGSLCSLLTTHEPLSNITCIMAVIFLVRELCLTIGVSIMWYLHGPVHFRPTWWGKCTMFLQSIFVSFLLICSIIAWYPYLLCWILLGTLGATSVISLVQYFNKFLLFLRQNKKP